MKLVRVCLLWVWLLSPLLAAAAEPTVAEARAFAAAAEAFRAGFFSRADSEFSEFITKHPESLRVPEARLLQAQARMELTNYVGALELLSSGQAQPGPFGDEFLFWTAEANLRQGNHARAAELFGQLVKDFPTSSRRLEAAVSEATSRARAGHWEQVIQALQATNSVFQSAVQANPTNGLVLRGWLLLAEAQLMTGNTAAAEISLQKMGAAGLHPRIEWQQKFLISRIQLSQGKVAEVLQATTNLLTLATNSNQRRLLAESFALRGSMLERLNRPEEAISAYRENLADGTPLERQRQALWKITELSLQQNRVPAAIETLEQFVKQHPGAAATDVALLSLGELRVRQHLAGVPFKPAGTNVTATNQLQLAAVSLGNLITNFAQSPLMGKARLNLGWVQWLSGQVRESEDSFASAANALPLSMDQAVALFKLGDAQFRQKEYPAAISSYEGLVERYGQNPEVRTNLLEAALYQQLRVGLEAGNLEAATNSLARILEWFPNGFHADSAVLLTGQALGKQHNPTAARELFEKFLGTAPGAPLAGEVELAVARTLEQEGKWADAAGRYDSWLQRFTNSPARPRAEYASAWAISQTGNEAAALSRFTNFVARFATNELTHMAQWWVADYHFRAGNFQQAEINYQLLFQSAPVSELACQAQMMAGRVALARQGWDDAKSYFTRLYENTNCSTEVRIQALFAHGDTLMSRDAAGTNRLANYEEAIRVFSSIAELYPESPLTPLALGEKANCYLQWVQYSQQYEPAMKAFNEVLASPKANTVTRSIARVGRAVVLERQAMQQTNPEQANLLRQALNQYLDVFFNKDLKEGEVPSQFWVRKAGLEAGRLAETLQEWPQAIAVYQRLLDIMPALKPSIEKRMLKAQENLSRSPG